MQCNCRFCTLDFFVSLFPFLNSAAKVQINKTENIFSLKARGELKKSTKLS